tara:strand:+ start:193 stop:456 length:264 start_codon:yes stop_codon:yes gene_type:complete
MKLLFLVASLYIAYLILTKKKNINKSNSVQAKKQSKSDYKYSPRQVKRKTKIDPMSKLDPIQPRKIVFCDNCGSERVYRESMETCCG